MPDLSLIICTHNRADYLETVLPSVIAQQRQDAIDFEVIVVLNGCTDSSEQVACQLLADSGLTHQIETEETLGLSHARNQGIKCASSDQIAFIDDDTRLPGDWLTSMVDAFAETDCDVVGGRVDLWFRDGPAPEGLHPFHHRLLGKNDHGSERVWGRPELVFGCNFAVRRKVFETCGTFGAQFGRVGEGRGAGEETDLVDRALAAGFSVMYEPTARLEHLVTKERLDIDYLAHCAYGAGHARAFFRATDKDLSLDYLHDIQDALAKVQFDEASAEKNSGEHRYYYCLKHELLGHLNGCHDRMYGQPFGAAPPTARLVPAATHRSLLIDVQRLSRESRQQALGERHLVLETLLAESPVCHFFADKKIEHFFSPGDLVAPYTVEFLLMADPGTERPFEPYGPHTPPMPMLMEPFSLYQLEKDLMQVKVGSGSANTRTFPCKPDWTHIAFTVDDQAQASVFVGGQKLLQVTLEDMPVAGKLMLGAGYMQRFWDGWFKGLIIRPVIVYRENFEPPSDIPAAGNTLLRFDGTIFVSMDDRDAR